MPTATRSPVLRFFIAALMVLALATAPAARAAVIVYHADLNGPNEPTPSPGLGTAEVDVDATAHTMRVVVFFSGLVGTTTASHIHCPTAVAGTGTAGVATTTPSFVGFPLGVTAGYADFTMDMTLTGSYNAPFITASGGTTALAEARLFQAIADGKAYLNIHSTVYAGGEIRGFLHPVDATPTSATSWGRLKALYK
jgi:hypothetical protein